MVVTAVSPPVSAGASEGPSVTQLCFYRPPASDGTPASANSRDLGMVTWVQVFVAQGPRALVAAGYEDGSLAVLGLEPPLLSKAGWTLRLLGLQRLHAEPLLAADLRLSSTARSSIGGGSGILHVGPSEEEAGATETIVLKAGAAAAPSDRSTRALNKILPWDFCDGHSRG